MSFKIEVEVTSLGHHIVYLYTDAPWSYLLLNMAVMVGLHFKEGKRQRQGGGTYEQPLSDKPPLIQCGETSSI